MRPEKAPATDPTTGSSTAAASASTGAASRSSTRKRREARGEVPVGPEEDDIVDELQKMEKKERIRTPTREPKADQAVCLLSLRRP